MFKKVYLCIFFVLIIFCSLSYAKGDKVSISGGVAYGKNSKKLPWFMFEYRPYIKLFLFSPWIGAGGTDKDIYGALGIAHGFKISSNMLLRLSFGAGLYHGNRNGLDLGYGLEFMSSAEVLYKIFDSLYLGVRTAHISNSDLGDKNPGTNIFSLELVLPVSHH